MEYALSFSGKSNLIFKLRFYWSRKPLLGYHKYSQIRYPQNTVSSKTNLLIEGFGRSGSSMTADCFRVLNKGQLQLVWNQKSIVGIHYASVWKVPTLVLIRDPKQVALSYKLMNGALKFETILTGYINYYRAAWKYREAFVLATNRTVLSDLKGVITNINEKFGTNFNQASDIEKLLLHVKSLQDNDYNTKYGKDWADSVTASVNYPTELKEKKKKELEGHLLAESNRKLLNNAQQIFQKFVSESSS